MLIDGVATRTVRADPAAGLIEVLDQTALPHQVRWVVVDTLAAAAHAITTMQVRGAPLIGATAAYGMAVAAGRDASDAGLHAAAATLAATRPTAVNLSWALHRMLGRLLAEPLPDRAIWAWREADAIAEHDVAASTAIGAHGEPLLRRLRPPAGRPASVLTHCNAGWLATVDRGTALAPVYAATDAGLELHVWVSETRPRNQGLLTAWELDQQGVPCTVIADNACGELIRSGQVDAVLVGADRIAANGDVANKIGTYLKALACVDAGIPCYVLAPASTIDIGSLTGAAIPIEERDGDELRVVHGLDAAGEASSVRQLAAEVPVYNPAFDVTPARLITAIVTEHGVAPATTDGVSRLMRGPA
jgi:methylthioribose-1-phosphate isomerase